MMLAIIAVAVTIVAWVGGRSTSYTAGSPTHVTVPRAQSLAFVNAQLVISQVDGSRVRVWQFDPASGAPPKPRVSDLATISARAPRPSGGPTDAAAPPVFAQQSVQQRAQELAPASQYAHTAPVQSPGVRVAVSIAADGATAAWILGRTLFVAALDGSGQPTTSTVDADGCVPQLGSGALVIACPDGGVEIRDTGGSLRGGIERSGPWMLTRDRESVLAHTGSELFDIRNAADPYTRLSGDFLKSMRAVARSRASQFAVATHDGKVTLADINAVRGELAAPGVADALAFLNQDRVLAGGSFRGIYVLQPGEAAQILAPDVVGTQLLAVLDDTYVAYSTADRVSVAAIHVATPFTSVGKVLLGTAIVCLLVIVISPMVRTLFLASLPDAAGYSKAPDEPAFTLDLPEPPAGLVRACTEGDCVLYAGAGLSAQAGYPIWQPFVESLLAWSRDNGKVDPAFAESLQAALRSGQVDPVADAIVSAVGRDEVMKRLSETFGSERRLPDTHKLLKRIPLCAALTTNFDTLLERAYPDATGRVFTPRDADRLLETLGRRTFFIAKLYGSLSQPDTVLFGPADYAETVARNLTFSQFMEGLFVSRTLFFVGASLEGIETYLSGLTFRGQMTRPHYALVAVTDAGWRAKADLLRRRYGIEVVPYTAGPRFDEVSKFLQQVADRTSAPSAAPETAAAQRPGAAQALRKIHLVNIGPFPELELDLQSDWNVILGDNGVGKSSILKALAACFCGKDVEPYASRLVRSGQPSGTIVLETPRNTYRMEIRLKSSGTADVAILPTRPLDVEGVLALGFPALRAVSWDRPRGATAEGRQRATVEDLLPIVKGDPDPRLDRLKQWIVNLDSRINYEKSHDGDKRYERLLQRFFEIVDRVTPGMAIKFGHVNQDTREVTVVTDDGEIPIELISQGSVSLMGWIGVLLQRLYEIHGDDADPTQRYALVLIDEIDAHMHPEWQQSIVDDMTGIFPNVQFLATTHSPLVVGGMKGRQVKRFVRDAEGRTVPMEVTDEMLVGRADQILTGRPFGMKTTLDSQTQQAMEEYKTLLGKGSRTSEEEKRFQDLHRELKFRIPNAEETAPARRAFALVEAIINDQIGGSVPEARKPLLDKARALLDEVSGSETKAV